MCGICGIVSVAPFDEGSEARVRAMAGAMIHRGPDSEGFFRNAHVSLAMRRLSIIDLAGGSQPLFNEDRSLVLVANGEIYNFRELRQDLIAKGHTFSSCSDCETILHLYEDVGADCVRHLRGMFAFALWDVNRNTLLLARDRMGEKPLYLYEEPGRLVFASELKALLHSGLVPFELDPEAVHLYFHYQYVPEPWTPLRGVRKLNAGATLTITVNPWNLREHRYWRMEDAPALEGDPAEVIREELDTVSDLVIRSDVPVGVALSGGLDSSAIAALASKKYPGVMHAFSVGYPGRPAHDERKAAKKFADHLDLPFHDIELETSEMVSFFPELVYLRDDPIADISGYGYYAVMKLAREHGVPVVLQGQGGDELFWGYPWMKTAARFTREKEALKSNGGSPFTSYWSFYLPSDLARPTLGQWVRSWAGIKLTRQAFRTHHEAPSEQFFFYDMAPDFARASQELPRFYAPTFSEAVRDQNPARLFTFAHPWPDTDVTLTRLICDTYLRENGIAQGDRLSMASSVELRLPLVDYRFVETVIGLRKAASDLGLSPKSRFKAALKGIVPEWVMNRPKRGFAPPVREWHSALFKAYGEQLRDGFLVKERVLSPEGARNLAEGPFPRGNIAPVSFKALVLELWCRKMAGGNPFAKRLSPGPPSENS